METVAEASPFKKPVNVTTLLSDETESLYLVDLSIRSSTDKNALWVPSERLLIFTCTRNLFSWAVTEKIEQKKIKENIVFIKKYKGPLKI